jgi:protein O-GlcNAc transferase
MSAGPVARATLEALLTDRDAARLQAALDAGGLDAIDQAALDGELARRRGDLSTAVQRLEAAIAGRSDVCALHHACALAHAAAGDRPRARTRWLALLERFPDDPLARFQIGVTHHDDGNLREAARWYGEQLARTPSMAAAWLNLGHVQRALGNAPSAIDAWMRAHAAKPDDSRPLLLAAKLAGEHADLPDAIDRATRALAISPTSAEAYFVRAAHRSSLALHADAVDDLSTATALDPTNAAGHSALLLELHYDETLRSPEAMRVEHEAWAARHAPEDPPRWSSRSVRRERLRVGYLSPRFGDAPLAALLLPVLEAHDRRRFERFAYATYAADGETARRIRASVDAWRVLPANDDEAQRIVEADSIDVLVDLCGHAPGNRLPLLSRRLAVRQATWLDYFDTTGMAAMDFLIGDAVHSPASHAGRFVERLVLLPHARFAYRPPAAFAARARSDRAGPVVFGSFNRHAKITDVVIDTWAAILDAVPGSRLVLRAAAYRSPSTVAWIRERWRARGIDVTRIAFDPFAGLAELHAAYDAIDLALDPFPFNGGVTTCDALAQGLPVITLEGDRMISRQGSALLGAAGRSRWIARSRDEYIALAVALSHRRTLEAERAALVAEFARSPLCDIAGFTATLERAYAAMLDDTSLSRAPMPVAAESGSASR